MKTIQPNTHIDYVPSGGYPPTYEDTPDTRRSLRQYFQVVYKRLPIILAITILATAAAAIYSYRLQSQYSTSTNIIIEPRKAPQAQKEGVTINMGDDEKYYRTQLELLRGPDLKKRVIVSLGLHRDPSLFAEQNRGLMAGLRSLFSGEKKPTETPNALPVFSETSTDSESKVKLDLTPEEDSRAGSYAAMFNVQAVPLNNTNIVIVSVDSTNQTVAPKVADKIAQLFIAENEERETRVNKQAYDELGVSIAGLSETINRQQDEYIAEMRTSVLGMGDESGKLNSSNLEGLLGSWARPRSRRARPRQTIMPQLKAVTYFSRCRMTSTS